MFHCRKVGEQIPKKAVQAIISQYDSSGDGIISFPDFVAIMYGLQTGTLNASNPSIRAFVLHRASHEAIVEMMRTSSTNLSVLTIRSNLSAGQDIRLYSALKTNTLLISLEISACGLQPSHATLIAEGLLHNTALMSLDLGSNPIGDEGFERIAEALRMTPDAQDAWDQVAKPISETILAAIVL
jgi:hypothetical protein